jgi:menaquinol-cytochrome c reductase iron-sulfur subunit
MDPKDVPPQPDRREFITKACALTAGAVAVAVPAASGLFVLLDPLGRKGGAGEPVRVASLEALPEDGEPRKFSVLATRVDAWNRTPNVPIGAVYLRRQPGGKVQAFNVVCPHAGCFVDYVAGAKHYLCPCHNSSFSPDGRIQDPKSPSPRGLDELETEVRDGAVFVRYLNFRAGEKDKVQA